MIDRATIEALGAKAVITTKSDHFKQGQGFCVVEELILEEKREGLFFIPVFEITENRSKGAGETNVVGNTVSNAANQRKDHGPGLMKSIVAAVLNKTQEQLNAPVLDAAGVPARLPGGQIATFYGQAVQMLVAHGEKTPEGQQLPIQPGRGVLVAFDTYEATVTKGANSGRKDTRVNYRPAPAEMNTKELIAQRRADLDKRKPLSK